MGIHDLSRTELDPNSRLPRFNMPLELGIFLGAKRYGVKRQRKKCVLILDRTQYRYQQFISDLAGVDIHAHGARPKRAIKETRNWLKNVSGLDPPGGAEIIKLYTRFRKQLPKLSRALKLDPDELTYADFVQIAYTWVKQAVQSGFSL